jgi:hypothetical protein
MVRALGPPESCTGDPSYVNDVNIALANVKMFRVEVPSQVLVHLHVLTHAPTHAGEVKESMEWRSRPSKRGRRHYRGAQEGR